MRLIHNPYRWDKVNIDLFYGRNQLRHELVEGLRNGQSFGITGGRRMGKTTLLRRVEADLVERAKQWADGGLLVVPVHIDGLALSAPVTPDKVFVTILKKIEKCISPSSANTTCSDQLPLHLFTARLEELIQNSSKYRLQIIVLFDEVEPILDCDWGRGFFSNWRALLHNEPTISPYISAVFTGATGMFQLAHDVGSPLGNILSWRELVLFSLEDTSLLVNEPTSYQLPSEFAERIFQETGGHPALIQYLMKSVCDRDLDEAEQSLNQAIESFHANDVTSLSDGGKSFRRLPSSCTLKFYGQVLQSLVAS